MPLHTGLATHKGARGYSQKIITIIHTETFSLSTLSRMHAQWRTLWYSERIIDSQQEKWVLKYSEHTTPESHCVCDRVFTHCAIMRSKKKKSEYRRIIFHYLLSGLFDDLKASERERVNENVSEMWMRNDVYECKGICDSYFYVPVCVCVYKA